MRARERRTPPLTTSVRSKDENDHAKMGRMAETADPNVYLGAVEATQDKGKEHDEIGDAPMAGPPKREHPKGILGGCRKWAIDAHDYE